MKRRNGDGTIRKIKKKNGQIYYQALSPSTEGHRTSLGLYPTKSSANKALDGFKRNSTSFCNITFEMLYHTCLNMGLLSNNDRYVYPYCHKLYKKRVVCIVREDIVQCITSSYRIDPARGKIKASPNTKQKIKSFLNRIFDYAISEGILLERNIPRIIEFNPAPKSSKNQRLFSKEEINILWDNANNPYISYIIRPVLICLYHGISAGQVVRIKRKDLLSNGILRVPIDKIGEYMHPIPLNPKLLDVVAEFSSKSNSEFLFADETGGSMTYDVFRGRYQKILRMLSCTHTIGDMRNTFLSTAEKVKLDPYILKHLLEVHDRRREPLVYDEEIMKKMKQAIISIGEAYDE